MSKRAIILAGGKGTRLRPYTVAIPKPLMPLGEYPILEVIIRQLVASGFDHITLAVNHQAEIISAFFGDGSKWEIKIDYSLEDKPLSTMGPLTLIPDLPENFLVMNGDVLTDLNYGEFYDHHCSQNNIFTISAYTRVETSEYGVLKINDQSTLTGFQEKPSVEHNVSMGVYMASKRIMDTIPEDTPYGLDHLMLDLLKTSTPPKVKTFKGIWLDIGRPADYEKATDLFEENRQTFLK